MDQESGKLQVLLKMPWGVMVKKVACCDLYSVKDLHSLVRTMMVMASGNLQAYVYALLAYGGHKAVDLVQVMYMEQVSWIDCRYLPN